MQPALLSSTYGPLTSPKKKKPSLGSALGSGGNGSGFSGNGNGGVPKKATAAVYIPLDNEDATEEEIPVSQETERISAWKVGILSVTDDCNGIVVLSPAQGTEFEVDMHATCNHGTKHKAPDLNCTCGFYAYRNFAELKKFRIIEGYGHRDQGQVLLSLDLSGRVIEHERLMRAERQIITCVWLPGECQECFEPSECVMFVNKIPKTYCIECSQQNPQAFMAKSPIFTLADMRNMLGTEVQFFTRPGW